MFDTIVIQRRQAILSPDETGINDRLRQGPGGGIQVLCGRHCTWYEHLRMGQKPF